MAIAVIAAIHKYFLKYPNGVAPGQVFLAEFLKPFIESELNTARIDELHRRTKVVTLRERELIDASHKLSRICAERIAPSFD